MFQLKARIVYNKKAGDKYRHMGIIAPKIADDCLPGQFLNVKIGGNPELLLRRPFSIHRVSGPKIEILYEVVGKGTQALSAQKAGGYLDVIGPLGNGFRLPAAINRLPVIVAGGMGVAPLIFLSEKLKEIQNPKSKIQNLVLIGAKTKDDVLCAKNFKELGCEVKIATDDGSRGFKGKVTELLKDFIHSRPENLALQGEDNQRPLSISLQETSGFSPRSFITHYTSNITPEIYACGPRPMLREAGRIAAYSGIPAQVSLEEHMACGIGACLGCIVQTKQGQKRACKDGPVFNAEEIIWPNEGGFKR